MRTRVKRPLEGTIFGLGAFMCVLVCGRGAPSRSLLTSFLISYITLSTFSILSLLLWDLGFGSGREKCNHS